ncbi:hypothetical protein C8J56DRAFT_1023575 [Mycena floridula]|nr:hypothetical protein C8J56DRAFT_1023575 [Mycena floridula]
MAASSTIEPFPELSFEIMAPNRAKELVTLSRSLQPVAEKALYHYVILEQYSSVELFSHSIQSGCRSSWVQVLFILDVVVDFNRDLSELHAILAVCWGIKTMGITGWTGDWPSNTALYALASTASRPAKLRYDLDWTQLSDGGHCFGLPLFQNVTHLEFWDYHNFANFNGKQLHCLTNLTHMSLIIDGPPFPEQLENLRRNLFLSDSIVVCIIFGQSQNMANPEHIQNICVRFTDPRVVFGFERGGNLTCEGFGNVIWREIFDRKHLVRQWGVRQNDDEEMDMWEEAESIVKSPGKPSGLYRTVDSN